MEVHQNAGQLEQTLDLPVAIGNREATEVLPAECPGSQDRAHANAVRKVEGCQVDQKFLGSFGDCLRGRRFEGWRCRDVQFACQGDTVPGLVAVDVDAEVA